jgi:hypothetical protein
MTPETVANLMYDALQPFLLVSGSGFMAHDLISVLSGWILRTLNQRLSSEAHDGFMPVLQTAIRSVSATSAAGFQRLPHCQCQDSPCLQVPVAVCIQPESSGGTFNCGSSGFSGGSSIDGTPTVSTFAVSWAIAARSIVARSSAVIVKYFMPCPLLAFSCADSPRVAIPLAQVCCTLALAATPSTPERGWRPNAELIAINFDRQYCR